MKMTLYGLPLLLVVAGCGGDDDVDTDPEPESLTLVRGALFTDNLADAQARHDMLAAGGEANAKAAGDIAHDVGLGSGILMGTEAKSFLAIDRWTDAAAMQSFYADPAFAEGFAQLFDGPPTQGFFSREASFHGWGSLDAGEPGPRWIVVARGVLAAPTEEERRVAHDQAAQGGEDMVRQAGDVAHVVYLGLEDRTQFLAFDVWTSSAAIGAVYTDPMFQAGFSTLFSGAPTIQVYEVSDWHQW